MADACACRTWTLRDLGAALQADSLDSLCRSENDQMILFQWIGLRENLQENPILHGKITLVSGEDFPKKTNPLFVANFPGLQEECAMAAGLAIAVASQFSWPRR